MEDKLYTLPATLKVQIEVTKLWKKVYLSAATSFALESPILDTKNEFPRMRWEAEERKKRDYFSHLPYKSFSL